MLLYQNENANNGCAAQIAKLRDLRRAARVGHSRHVTSSSDVATSLAPHDREALTAWLSVELAALRAEAAAVDHRLSGLLTVAERLGIHPDAGTIEASPDGAAVASPDDATARSDLAASPTSLTEACLEVIGTGEMVDRRTVEQRVARLGWSIGRNSVVNVLMRLARRGQLERPDRGYYRRPRHDTVQPTSAQHDDGTAETPTPSAPEPDRAQQQPSAPRSIANRVLDVLHSGEAGAEWSVKAVQNQLPNDNRRTIAAALTTLATKGSVERVRRGAYRAAPTAEQAAEPRSSSPNSVTDEDLAERLAELLLQDPEHTWRPTEIAARLRLAPGPTLWRRFAKIAQNRPDLTRHSDGRYQAAAASSGAA